MDQIADGVKERDANDSVAVADDDVIYSKLPGKELLSSLNINGILNNSNCKSYLAVVFENKGDLIYSWFLSNRQNKRHDKDELNEENPQNEQNEQKDKDDDEKYAYFNDNREIIKPINVIKCYKIIKICLNILKKYSNLTDEISDIFQETSLNSNSNNNGFQLIKLNYENNKELMIIPNDELILCIAINK